VRVFTAERQALGRIDREEVGKGQRSLGQESRPGSGLRVRLRPSARSALPPLSSVTSREPAFTAPARALSSARSTRDSVVPLELIGRNRLPRRGSGAEAWFRRGCAGAGWWHVPPPLPFPRGGSGSRGKLKPAWKSSKLQRQKRQIVQPQIDSNCGLTKALQPMKTRNSKFRSLVSSARARFHG